MSKTRLSFLTLPTLALGIGLVALTLLISGDGTRTGFAAFGVSDPTPGAVDTLAVDTNTTGNTPTSVSTVESCRTVAGGVTTKFDIDIVVDEIPAYNTVSDGVSGIGANLVYDPAILEVDARAAGSAILFHQAVPLGGGYLDVLSDAVPDTDGDYRHDAASLGGTSESGEGVMMRLTMEIVGLGVSTLDLADNIEFDGTPNVLDFPGAPYPLTNTLDGEIHTDGSACAAPTATLNVAKDFSDNDVNNVTITVNCTGTSVATAIAGDNTASEADDANFSITNPTAGNFCTATETVPGGYTANQAPCAAILISSATTFNCTITNTLQSATFNVNKDFIPNNAADVTVGLLCTSGTVVDNDVTASESDAANFTINGFSPGATCTAVEGVPVGYAADQTDCASKPITAGQLSTCTIINRTSGTVTVSKDFSDDAAINVILFMTCDSGTVVANDPSAQEGVDTAEFTVTGFTTPAICGVGETNLPSGYIFSTGNCGALIIGPGNAEVCTVVNNTFRQINVSKDFSDDNPADVTIDVLCTGGNPGLTIVVDATASESDAATFSVLGFTPGVTTCTATENPIPAGYSNSNLDCQNESMTVSALAINCTMLNSASHTLNITKDFTDSGSTDTRTVSVTLDCTPVPSSIAPSPTQLISEANSPVSFTVNGYGSGTTCSATELNVPNGYAQSANTCTGFPLPVPATTTQTPCTITNAPSTGTFTVTKDYIPDLAGNAVTVNLVCSTGTIVSNDLLASEGSPAVFTVNAFNNGATCTATESGVLAGYEEDETGCDAPGVAMVNGGNAGCTMVNRTYAQIHVAVNFSDNSGTELIADLFGASCGTITSSDTGATEVPADTADFELRGFTPGASCSVNQGAPQKSGYLFERGGNYPPGCNAVPINPGDNLTCTTTMTVQTSQITIEKDYIGGGTEPQVTITVTCNTDTDIQIGAPQPADEPSPDAVITVSYVDSDDVCSATESVPAGYTANQSDCANKDVDLFPSIPAAEFISCTITNTLNTAVVNVAKDFLDANPGSVDVALACTSGTVGNVDTTASEADDANFTVSGHNAGATCTATESNQPSGYNPIANTCNPSAAISTSGGTTNCLITNGTEITVTIAKDFVPTVGTSVSVTLVCSGGGTQTPPGAQNVTDGAPAAWTIANFTSAPSCTATESVIPTGYSSTGNCTTGTLSGNGGCTIVNTLRTTTVNVNKDFSDNSVGSVTVALSCSSGSVANTDTSASEADDANFTVTGFSLGATCTATETAPAGYTANQTACAAQTIAHTGSTTCTIVNTLNSEVVKVFKDFSNDDAQDVTIQLTCSSGIVANIDTTASEADPADFTVTGFNTVGSTCTATETVPGGYSPDESDCLNVPILAGDGFDMGCTILNSSEVFWTIRKVWLPAKAGSVIITFTCTSGDVTILDPSASQLDTAEFLVENMLGGTTCTATENAQPGYTANQTDCFQQNVNRGSCTILNGLGNATPTFTNSPTPTQVPTNSPSPTATPTATPTPTNTPSPTPVNTNPTDSPTPTASKRPTRTPIGGAPSVTATPQPTNSPSPTLTPAPATDTPTPGPATATPRPTRTPVGGNSVSSALRGLSAIW